VLESIYIFIFYDIRYVVNALGSQSSHRWSFPCCYAGTQEGLQPMGLLYSVRVAHGPADRAASVRVKYGPAGRDASVRVWALLYVGR
jgi:hypothetical protein